ncbi:MAG: ABC transporter ATP-binding protein [Candidatus Dormibacteraeota bacterium]|nr:ABC transporter ATP-binding protein [Candidatus Dormibacteraeota bacterium]
MSADPWFVKRQIGFGWRPAAWQGWVITVVVLGSGIAAVIVGRVHKSLLGYIGLLAAFGLYALVASAAARVQAGARATATAAAPTATAPASAAPAPRAIATAPAPVRPALDTSRPPALVVDHLTKRFGDRVAFQDVSFTVGAGEVFGFLGPNGAGKTTTVRTLGTLIAPTSGSAIVAGMPLLPENGQAIRQRIAIMPEAPGLYLRLSVRENLQYFAGLFSIANPNERIGEVLEAVNMLPRIDDLCGSLSKGLKQRAGLARALLSNPEVLFLDEPTSGLDPVATRDVNDLIEGLRRRGVTVFLTTHRLEEAQRLCDRVAILNTTMRMVGRPDDLRAKLFSRALVVATASPLSSPANVFDSVKGIDGWSLDAVQDENADASTPPPDGGARYVVNVSDPKAVAPELTRALVAAGADVEQLAERVHSLEDIYLQLVNEDVEATHR